MQDKIGPFHQQHAIVVGGSSGIGKAIAKHHGKQLASGSIDNTVKLWQFQP